VAAADSRDSANRGEEEFLGQAGDFDLPARGDPGIFDVSIDGR
jgi:hypothetical protein